jgi:hypothetical protein
VDHGPVASRAEQQTFEKGAVTIPHCGAARAAVPLEHLLNPAKDIGRDDCWMLPVMEFDLVFDFAHIDGIGEQVVHTALVERPSTLGQTLLRLPRLVAPASVDQVVDHRQERLRLQVETEDLADADCFFGVHNQLRAAVRPVNIVAQDGRAARPLALPSLGGDFVADTLADDLSLELCEREEDIEYQPPHRGRRVELLGDGHERDVLLVENLHNPGEIQERPAQPVHFVDDNAIHLPGLDVGQQTLQGWSVHVATREAAVVVVLGQAPPSFVLLAGNVRFARLPLGVESIELLFEALLGGLPRVDGTSDCGYRFFLAGFSAHRSPSSLKNR